MKWRWPWRSSGVEIGAEAGADDSRWIVLDVESSGLDPAHDRLLAIGAVVVRTAGPRGWVDMPDSFEAVLGQPAHGRPPDKANILIHGLGVGTQRRGMPAAQALQAFAAWAGTAPRLGFHVGFDRALIDRACFEALGECPRARWLDIEPLAAVTHPQVKARSLDDWLGHFGITNLARHEAVADALATAELLLCLEPALRREGAAGSFAACQRLAARRRWIAP